MDDGKRGRRSDGRSKRGARRRGAGRPGRGAAHPRPEALRLVITADGRVVLRAADTVPPRAPGDAAEDAAGEWG